jgi:DNA topoisomerase-3
VFYDDCLVANTTVIGKRLMSPSKPPEKKSEKGWRIVLRTQTQRKETDILPSFVKGEKVLPSFF